MHHTLRLMVSSDGPQTAWGAAGYSPYPSQPQPEGVTAPGGYPAVPVATGTVNPAPGPGPVYPPQPHMGQAGSTYPSPQQQPLPVQGLDAAAHSKPSAGYPYPAGAPVGSPYPPASSGPGPFSGQPVSGPPDATGMHVHGMDMAHGSTVPVAPAISNEPCRCSIGWVLFAIGFIFWPCWVAAAFVPL